MPSKIEEWLNAGCNFQSGVDLYRKLGNNTALLTLFLSGESPYATRRLKEELLKIPGPTLSVVKDKPQYQVTDLPLELQGEYKRKAALYAQASQLHGDLFHASDNGQRQQIREQIISLFDEIDRIWNKCDQHVISERTQSIVNPDKASLLQMRNNLRSRISKAKRKSDFSKVAELQNQLMDVETKLSSNE